MISSREKTVAVERKGKGYRYLGEVFPAQGKRRTGHYAALFDKTGWPIQEKYFATEEAAHSWLARQETEENL